jgi:predicted ester cyclase
LSRADKERLDKIPLEAINKGNLDVLDDVLASDMAEYPPAPGFPPGREGVKSFITSLRSAFPDIRYTLLHTVEEGDIIVQHVRVTGTMTGDFAEMKASGKRATWDEVHIVRMSGGVAVEHWGLIDQLGMLQQLGFLPASAAQRAA